MCSFKSVEANKKKNLWQHLFPRDSNYNFPYSCLLPSFILSTEYIKRSLVSYHSDRLFNIPPPKNREILILKYSFRLS